jgi:hypothetical protein
MPLAPRRHRIRLFTANQVHGMHEIVPIIVQLSSRVVSAAAAAAAPVVQLLWFANATLLEDDRTIVTMQETRAPCRSASGCPVTLRTLERTTVSLHRQHWQFMPYLKTAPACLVMACCV